MGLFRRKQRDDDPGAATPERPPLSDQGKQYRAALLDGNQTGAEALLGSYIQGGAATSDFLLDQAASVRRALDEGRWDAAADLLATWSTEWPMHHCDDRRAFVDAAAGCVARGFGLVEFLTNPATAAHPQYDALLDDGLVSVTKAVRHCGLPRPSSVPPEVVRVDFDPTYARLKSARELERARR